MKKTKLYIAEIPPVSNEYAHHIDKTFPKLEAVPGVSQDDILYNAGMRKVVDYILRSASGTVVLGDEKELKNTEKPSLLSKFINRLQ